MDQNETNQSDTDNELNPYNTREQDSEHEPSSDLGNPSIFGMITSPREQFEKIVHQPKFLIAIIIVTLLTFIGALLTFVNFNLPPDILFGLGEEEQQFVIMISKATLIIAGLIGPIFGILLSTVIYFIVAKILKSEITFKQTFSMFSYIGIISAISALLHGIIMLLVPNLSSEIIVTSLGSLVQTGDVFQAVLNSIEIFAIWQLIITAIGLQVVAKFSKRAAWTTVIVIFAIGLVLQMVSAAINALTAI